MSKYKKVIIFSLIITVLIITFANQYLSSIQDIETTAKNEEAQIDRYIDLSKGFIDLIAIYGNDYFNYEDSHVSDLESFLEYNPATNNYNLDAIEGTSYQAFSGNLTGSGHIPADGIHKTEINLALHLNREFSSIYNILPEVAWLYYTSKNNFINIYPWISSKEFKYDEALQLEKFYSYVTPENNPLRESIWTPVYLDHAGKGLMVTLSSPVYAGDTFMGAVSLDFTNNQLSEIIKCRFETYIVDQTNSLMATSLDLRFDKDLINFYTLIGGSPDDCEKLENMEKDKLQLLGNYYIYSFAFDNAPWKMYIRVPVWLVMGKAFLYTLPMLIICMLLLFTYWEVDKRRLTEQKLNKSLKELTSYQTLLENAAKYDFLTATVNRRGLIDIFEKNIGQNEQAENKVVFIMGDIDNFKTINDTYGHSAGDKVLKTTAAIMQKNIGSNDVVCRWGGEEFVIMLMNNSYDEAILIAENIREDMEINVIPWDNCQKLRATMTFGVAEHNPGDNINISIAKADAALYIGKEKGRNKVIGHRHIK